MRRDGDIEYVRATLAGLVVQSKVQRNVQFLQDVVQLTGHNFRYVGVEHIAVVHDSGLLVWHKAAGDQKGKELALNLVISVQSTLHPRFCGRVKIRDINGEREFRLAHFSGHPYAAVHKPSRGDRGRVSDQSGHRSLC